MRLRLQEAGRFPWVGKVGQAQCHTRSPVLTQPPARSLRVKTLNATKGSNLLMSLFPSRCCVPYSTLSCREPYCEAWGKPPGWDAHLPTLLCSAGPARGKIWPINQAPAAWTKGRREQVHLWRGQLLLLGVARRQHQRVGQELGSWWPGKLLCGGMWWLRRPIVHPTVTLGLGTP